LIAHKTDPYSTFISSSIKIPPTKLQNQYGAKANFVVPRSFLDQNLSFFILLKDLKVISNHTMPNTIAGIVDTLDDLIKTSYYSKTHDRVPFRITWSSDSVIYSSISHSRCIVEMSVRPVEESKEKDLIGKDIDDLDYNKIKEKMIKNTLDSM